MKRNKRTSYIIGGFLVILMVCLTMLIPTFIADLKEQRIAKIKEELQEIYTTAIVVDDLDGGLHNDSDNAGKYAILSSKSGFEVHNSPKKGKYSLTKDYKTGEIVVHYGMSEIVYPEKSQPGPEVTGDIKNEDLFDFDDSTGKVVLLGFSDLAASNLSSTSTIKIPATYNGKPVVEIADKAFYGKNLGGSVVIPKSVRAVGRYSFSNNGPKSDSGNIGRPYAGTWKLEKDKWVKVEEE